MSPSTPAGRRLLHAEAACVAFDAFDRLGSATFPISWLTPNTPHNCCVRLVAPSPEAHATLTTSWALPLTPAFLKYIGFANPNRCSRGAPEGIETNSCITVVRPSRRAPSSGLGQALRALLQPVKELKCWLRGDRASFETAALRPPQDEAGL